MNERAPELLAYVADTVADELVKAGLAVERAADIGIAVADRVRKDHGGEIIYMPKGESIDIYRRDLEIFDKFSGSNHHALAREYGMSVVYIYRIVKTVRAEMVRRRQGTLFEERS